MWQLTSRKYHLEKHYIEWTMMLAPAQHTDARQILYKHERMNDDFMP